MFGLRGREGGDDDSLATGFTRCEHRLRASDLQRLQRRRKFEHGGLRDGDAAAAGTEQHGMVGLHSAHAVMRQAFERAGAQRAGVGQRRERNDRTIRGPFFRQPVFEDIDIRLLLRRPRSG